jgi:hypothetical protein
MTVLWVPTNLPLNSGQFFAGFSVRNECQSLSSASGGQIKITLDNTFNTHNVLIDHVSIGIGAGSGSTTTTPVEVLFGGLSGCTILAGQSITSDLTNFNCLVSDTLVVIIDVNSSSPGIGELMGNAGENGNVWYGAGGSYNSSSAAGFSEEGSQIFAVSLIETVTSGGITISITGTQSNGAPGFPTTYPLGISSFGTSAGLPKETVIFTDSSVSAQGFAQPILSGNVFIVGVQSNASAYDQPVVQTYLQAFANATPGNVFISAFATPPLSAGAVGLGVGGFAQPLHPQPVGAQTSAVAGSSFVSIQTTSALASVSGSGGIGTVVALAPEFPQGVAAISALGTFTFHFFVFAGNQANAGPGILFGLIALPQGSRANAAAGTFIPDVSQLTSTQAITFASPIAESISAFNIIGAQSNAIALDQPVIQTYNLASANGYAGNFIIPGDAFISSVSGAGIAGRAVGAAPTAIVGTQSNGISGIVSAGGSSNAIIITGIQSNGIGGLFPSDTINVSLLGQITQSNAVAGAITPQLPGPILGKQSNAVAGSILIPGAGVVVGTFGTASVGTLVGGPFTVVTSATGTTAVGSLKPFEPVVISGTQATLSAASLPSETIIPVLAGAQSNGIPGTASVPYITALSSASSSVSAGSFVEAVSLTLAPALGQGQIGFLSVTTGTSTTVGIVGIQSAVRAGSITRIDDTIVDTGGACSGAAGAPFANVVSNAISGAAASGSTGVPKEIIAPVTTGVISAALAGHTTNPFTQVINGTSALGVVSTLTNPTLITFISGALAHGIASIAPAGVATTPAGIGAFGKASASLFITIPVQLQFTSGGATAQAIPGVAIANPHAGVVGVIVDGAAAEILLGAFGPDPLGAESDIDIGTFIIGGNTLVGQEGFGVADQVLSIQGFNITAISTLTAGIPRVTLVTALNIIAGTINSHPAVISNTVNVRLRTRRMR